MRLSAWNLVVILVWLTGACSSHAQSINDLGSIDDGEVVLDESLSEKLNSQLEEGSGGESHAGAPAYWEALKIFEGPEPKDLEKGREYLLESAERGFSPAQNYMGICRVHGLHGFRKSKRQSANWFEQAANQGDAFAQINIGLSYYSGIGVWKNHAKAKDWLLKAMDPEADFPRPVAPDDYWEAIQGEPGEETVDLLRTGSMSDLSYTERIKAASLLSSIFQKEKELEEAHKYAVFASGFEKNSKDGNYGQAIQAALNYAFGEGTEKNREAAQAMLEFSKQLQRNWVQNFVHSLGVDQFLDEFELGALQELLKDVAEEAATNVGFQVANRFSDEDSDEWDVEEAIPWYEMAAESGRAWAMLNLAFIYSDPESGMKDDEKALHWFTQASEKGNHTIGNLNSGICYFHGIGTDKDPDAAQEFFDDSRDVSFACYRASEGEVPDGVMTYDEAFDWHKKSIKGRDVDPHALYLMGIRYEKGWGVERNYSRSYSHYWKAAKAGHAEAMTEVALDYGFGLSHTANLEKAYDFLLEADELGSKNAPYYLGFFNANGYGVEEDDDKAIEWYEKSLEVNPESSSSLNNMNRILHERLEELMEQDSPDPDEVKRTSKVVIENYEKASEMGNRAAAYNLGRIYYFGRLVDQDYRKAYEYFQLAADRGEEDANFYLGQMHHYGEGMPKTPREAAFYYRKVAYDSSASNYCRTRAFNRIVFFYRYGIGVPRDLDRALYWSYLQIRLRSALGYKRYGDILMDAERYEEAEDYWSSLTRFPNNYLKAHANARLGEIHGAGLGRKVNNKRMNSYLKKSVELKGSYGYFMIANSMVSAQKFREAVRFYLISILGSCTSDEEADSFMITVEGEEIEIDRYRALEAPASVYKLGCLVLAGQGIEQNTELAWKLFLLAAELGSTDAQFNIGIATLKQSPEAPGYEKAIELVQMAANLNHPRAKELLEKLQQAYDKQLEEEKKSGDQPEDTSGSWWTEMA